MGFFFERRDGAQAKDNVVVGVIQVKQILSNDGFDSCDNLQLSNGCGFWFLSLWIISAAVSEGMGFFIFQFCLFLDAFKRLLWQNFQTETESDSLLHENLLFLQW